MKGQTKFSIKIEIGLLLDPLPPPPRHTQNDLKAKREVAPGKNGRIVFRELDPPKGRSSKIKWERTETLSLLEWKFLICAEAKIESKPC